LGEWLCDGAGRSGRQSEAFGKALLPEAA